MSLLASDLYTRMSLLSLAAMVPDHGNNARLGTAVQDLSSPYLAPSPPTKGNLPVERDSDKLYIARLTQSWIAELEAKRTHFACLAFGSISRPVWRPRGNTAVCVDHRLELHESRLLLLRSLCIAGGTVGKLERK